MIFTPISASQKCVPLKKVSQEKAALCDMWTSYIMPCLDMELVSFGDMKKSSGRDTDTTFFLSFFYLQGFAKCIEMYIIVIHLYVWYWQVYFNIVSQNHYCNFIYTHKHKPKKECHKERLSVVHTWQVEEGFQALRPKEIRTYSLA